MYQFRISPVDLLYQYLTQQLVGPSGGTSTHSGQSPPLPPPGVLEMGSSLSTESHGSISGVEGSSHSLALHGGRVRSGAELSKTTVHRVARLPPPHLNSFAEPEP